MSELLVNLLPTTPFWEDHFGRLKVSVEDVASGRYRGTWITQYAQLLRQEGVRLRLVVPSRNRTCRVEGELLDVQLVRGSWFSTRWPRVLTRGPFRALLSFVSTYVLLDYLRDAEYIYVQEYSSGRFAAVAKSLTPTRLIGAYHGQSINHAPRWIRRAVARSTATLTTLTSTELEALRTVGVGPGRGLKLPNPVDDVWFSRSTIPSSERRDLVWVGRIEDRAKNLRLLVDALAILHRRGLGVSASVVGDGPDRATIEQYAQTSGVAEQINFLGRIDDLQELVQTVQSHRFIINTSRVEGLPISLIEGLAAGLGAIVSDLDYATSEFDSTEAVSLFRSDDASDAAKVIAAAITRSGEIAASDEQAALAATYRSVVFRKRFLHLLGLP